MREQLDSERCRWAAKLKRLLLVATHEGGALGLVPWSPLWNANFLTEFPLLTIVRNKLRARRGSAGRRQLLMGSMSRGVCSAAPARTRERSSSMMECHRPSAPAAETWRSIGSDSRRSGGECRDDLSDSRARSRHARANGARCTLCADVLGTRTKRLVMTGSMSPRDGTGRPCTCERTRLAPSERTVAARSRIGRSTIIHMSRRDRQRGRSRVLIFGTRHETESKQPGSKLRHRRAPRDVRLQAGIPCWPRRVTLETRTERGRAGARASRHRAC